MRGRGDALLEAALARRLEAGPATFVELAAVARAAPGSPLPGREGALHAILHRLVREGTVVPLGPSAEGGTAYGAAGTKAPPPPAPEAPPPPASARDARIASRVASGARDPADRGRVVVDVLAHRGALGAGAGRAFGRVRAAADSMRRADRGRAAVFAPADVVDRAIAFVLHDGPSLLVTAAVLLLVWLFVAEPRQIPSHSMEPTLSPTDRLIVWKWGRGKEPDRWDVVLFPSPADGRTLIKRAVGLGGEQVQIDNGDVWADGKMLVKPDDLRLAVRERLDVPSPDGPEGAAAWAATGDACGRRAYAKPLFADEPRYVGSDGRPEPTSSERPRVHDVYLEADVVSDASGHAGLYVEWVDDGDRPANRDLGIAVTVSPEGVRTGAYGGDPCGSFGATVPSAGVPAGRSSRLSLSLVDGVLRAGGGGTSAWSEVAVPKGHARILVAGTVRGLVVHRDVHYTQPRDATYAVNPGNPAEVPEGSIFCLGDHSSNSRDSRFREVGFIPVSSLVGKAVFRVWPLNRVGLVH